MGGGNDREALLAYADAVRELWPSMTVEDFEGALRHGLANVKWFGKLTIPAIAEFIRDHKQPKKWTKPEAEAWIESYKQRLGIKPGEPIPTAEIPNDIYHAWRGYAKS
jgi:hypothetical protein